MCPLIDEERGSTRVAQPSVTEGSGVARLIHPCWSACSAGVIGAWEDEGLDASEVGVAIVWSAHRFAFQMGGGLSSTVMFCRKTKFCVLPD